jgi:hypothetical protein
VVVSILGFRSLLEQGALDIWITLEDYPGWLPAGVHVYTFDGVLPSKVDIQRAIHLANLSDEFISRSVDAMQCT